MIGLKDTPDEIKSYISKYVELDCDKSAVLSTSTIFNVDTSLGGKIENFDVKNNRGTGFAFNDNFFFIVLHNCIWQ